ncbi:hypothetical protein [Lysobacter gummosus]|uniref:hypothetical protein n=1 Tax=Lysobacter gummosus TaxID=262324 RepID=UPI003628A9A0
MHRSEKRVKARLLLTPQLVPASRTTQGPDSSPARGILPRRYRAGLWAGRPDPQGRADRSV